MTTSQMEYRKASIIKAATVYGCVDILGRFPVYEHGKIADWEVPANHDDAVDAALEALLYQVRDYVRELCKKGIRNEDPQ
jgi:hypothetical protein